VQLVIFGAKKYITFMDYRAADDAAFGWIFPDELTSRSIKGVQVIVI
jgi:hypothetical protein